MEKWSDKKILFYDGSCGFCNRSVQFVLDHEKNQLTYFVPLQSVVASDFFEFQGLEKPDLSTLYYWNGKKLYNRSSGALHLAMELKLPYRLLTVFLVIPRFIRDGCYGFIAKRRHRILPGNCVLPTPEQKMRFLY